MIAVIVEGLSQCSSDASIGAARDEDGLSICGHGANCKRVRVCQEFLVIGERKKLTMGDILRRYLSCFQLPKKENSIVDMVSPNESSRKYTKAGDYTGIGK